MSRLGPFSSFRNLTTLPGIEAINVDQQTDLEKGRSTISQHVVLSITGMDCGGCESKLNRALGNISGLSELETGLIPPVASFCLDTRELSLDAVISHVEKATGFKVKDISNQQFSVDVLAPGGSSSAFVEQGWPRDVRGMTVVDKTTVNIAFDQKTRVRDLLEGGWDVPLTLAPRRLDPALVDSNKDVRHLGWRTLLSWIFTIPVMVLHWADVSISHELNSGICFALATVVQFVFGWSFYCNAWQGIYAPPRVIEMDMLVALSTTAAYAVSFASFVCLVSDRPPLTDVFFETSTMLISLILTGQYVSAVARNKAHESISVRSLQSPTAILVNEDGTGSREIDVRLLQYGDYFKVIPGSVVPTDGQVQTGNTDVVTVPISAG